MSSAVSFAMCAPVATALIVGSLGIGVAETGRLVMARSLNEAVAANGYQRRTNDAVKTQMCDKLESYGLRCDGIEITSEQHGTVDIVTAKIVTPTLPFVGAVTFRSSAMVKH